MAKIPEESPASSAVLLPPLRFLEVNAEPPPRPLPAFFPDVFPETPAS